MHVVMKINNFNLSLQCTVKVNYIIGNGLTNHLVLHIFQVESISKQYM